MISKKGAKFKGAKMCQKNVKTFKRKHKPFLKTNWHKFIAPILRINTLLAKYNQTTTSGFLINNKGAKIKGVKICQKT